jgi:hypothetical protein
MGFLAKARKEEERKDCLEDGFDDDSGGWTREGI